MKHWKCATNSESTLIWRFIVRQNRVMKYITKIGQNTGILKTSKKVHTKAIIVDFETEYQNLNSGSLLMKGRNSSFTLVGNSGPSSDSKIRARGIILVYYETIWIVVSQSKFYYKNTSRIILISTCQAYKKVKENTDPQSLPLLDQFLVRGKQWINSSGICPEHKWLCTNPAWMY